MFIPSSKGSYSERDPESHFSDLFLLLNKININKVSSQPVIEKYFVFIHKQSTISIILLYSLIFTFIW